MARRVLGGGTDGVGVGRGLGHCCLRLRRDRVWDDGGGDAGVSRGAWSEKLGGALTAHLTHH